MSKRVLISSAKRHDRLGVKVYGATNMITMCQQFSRIWHLSPCGLVLLCWREAAFCNYKNRSWSPHSFKFTHTDSGLSTTLSPFRGVSLFQARSRLVLHEASKSLYGGDLGCLVGNWAHQSAPWLNSPTTYPYTPPERDTHPILILACL